MTDTQSTEREARGGRGVGWDFSVGSGYLLPNCA
eukprot:COSAG02_NODE_26240_length_637_cov_1.925651_1_plen_33_part_01